MIVLLIIHGIPLVMWKYSWRYSISRDLFWFVLSPFLDISNSGYLKYFHWSLQSLRYQDFTEIYKFLSSLLSELKQITEIKEHSRRKRRESVNSNDFWTVKFLWVRFAGLVPLFTLIDIVLLIWKMWPGHGIPGWHEENGIKSQFWHCLSQNINFHRNP